MRKCMSKIIWGRYFPKIKGPCGMLHIRQGLGSTICRYPFHYLLLTVLLFAGNGNYLPLVAANGHYLPLFAANGNDLSLFAANAVYCKLPERVI